MPNEALWSPYLVGAGIGVLSWLTFLLSGHPLGVSSAIAATAGMIEQKLRGPRAERIVYYRENPPRIDWEWMLVVGLLVGAATSALASGGFEWSWVPPLWSDHFGPGGPPRLLTALTGGILVGFGARWGCGCTSGHGISGSLQLVLSSWIAALCFLVGGVAAAFALYGG
jgi:uncharacterized protein